MAPAPAPAPAPLAPMPPGARDALLALCGPGHVLDVDANGFRAEDFDGAISVAAVAAHPRPREAAARLTAVVRPGGAIAFAAPSGSEWSRYETAYRHFHGFPDFDVLERPGFAIVFARRP